MRHAPPLVAWLTATALGAQNAPAPPPKTEQELDKQVATQLVAFARMAESMKLPSRARRVYEQILDHYDIDQPPARAGLGYKRVKDQWQQVTAPDKLPADAATAAQKKSVDDAWAVTSKRIGKLHADLGHALRAAGEEMRGRYQLERAVVFAPDDVAAHQALGHEEFDGFHGTAEQIAFVKRLREVFEKALECAAMDVEVKEVSASELPRELREVGVEFAGARSKTVTYWVAGSFDEAANCARWHERALAMTPFLLGDAGEVRMNFKPQPVRWVVVPREYAQQKRLLETCKAARGSYTVEIASMLGGHGFDASSGRAEWLVLYRHEGHDHDADHAVGLVAKRSVPWFNAGFGEGLVHTMTWLLCGTLESSYMQLAATAAGKQETRSRDPEQCLQQLRDDIDAGTDWPLVQVPRERMENFRPTVRNKSWSFVTWLLARHPDRWAKLLLQLGDKPKTEQEVAAIFEQVLGEPLAESDAQWREWARRGSLLGKTSRLPQ